ncbi:hypothetical protein DDE82_005723 [Stemphylium lycopersici]|uniref:Uncharacterized protein n=1 Tax=Stemphylium lycopersici TaxID=183478 RepID=A0A364N775_STELY|nr:hypothetical protein DDE82_005723 [Stemphylium lycopersici]RAR13159.1 hypothetical protein DDE83_003544 [Stemphylium lycopersici]
MPGDYKLLVAIEVEDVMHSDRKESWTIGAAKPVGEDYQILATKLDIQKTLLLLWGRRLKLFDSEKCDPRLNDPTIATQIEQGLPCIRFLLQDSEKLQQRYGVKPSEINESVEVSTAVRDRLMSEFRNMKISLKARHSSPPTRSSMIACASYYVLLKSERLHSNANKIKWVIKDKERFGNLIGFISGLIADLDRLIPSRSGDESIQNVLLKEIRGLKDIFHLKMVSTNGAFAFFIDGLDEFKGNHRDGIKFRKDTVTSANVKILLSIRPLDTCVAAFDSKLKPRLQDLTRRDIDIYINEVIRSHPYVADSSHSSESTVEELILKLGRKAHGVFLWVVLACRTLLEGFEACDNGQELNRRVDNLPPELEELFQHILEGLPPHYLQQAAKLLRVCFSVECNDMGPIATLGLAWADEGNMDLDRLEHPKPCSIEEVKQKCRLLEGRLRSRCRVLLEVEGDISDIELENRASLESQTVMFMHRTVFEFLSQPNTWELPCLRIQDKNFEPIVIASYMSSYILYVYKGQITQDNIWYGISVLGFINESLPTYLSRALELFSFFGQTGGNLSLESAILLLAVENDWKISIQRQQVNFFNSSRVQDHGGSYQVNNLLYHAMQKHLSGYPDQYPELPKESTVELLLRFGCDPSERIVNSCDILTPPWNTWCDEVNESIVDLRGAIRASAITLLLILHGAILAPPETRTNDYHPRFITKVREWPELTKDGRATSISKGDRLRKNCDQIIEAIEASYADEPQWGNEQNGFKKEDRGEKKRKKEDEEETECSKRLKWDGS